MTFPFNFGSLHIKFKLTLGLINAQSSFSLIQLNIWNSDNFEFSFISFFSLSCVDSRCIPIQTDKHQLKLYNYSFVWIDGYGHTKASLEVPSRSRALLPSNRNWTWAISMGRWSSEKWRRISILLHTRKHSSICIPIYYTCGINSLSFHSHFYFLFFSSPGQVQQMDLLLQKLVTFWYQKIPCYLNLGLNRGIYRKSSELAGIFTNSICAQIYTLLAIFSGFISALKICKLKPPIGKKTMQCT